MPEQASLFRGAKRRPTAELEGATDVVDQGGGTEEVTAQAGMELGGLAAERCHSDRVLEEPAGVAVVTVRSGGRKGPKCSPDLIVAENLREHRGETCVGDLAGKEVEEAVQLLGVPAHGRRQLGWIAVWRSLDRPHLHLESAPEPLHATEHTHGVTLGEAAVEQLDVVPDSCFDPAACVDELEGEIGRSVLRPPPLLSTDGEHALDRAILRELRDAGHAGSLGAPGGTLGPWPMLPRSARFAMHTRRPP